MKIYVIKITVRGVSPMVWRRLRIGADTSLTALHFTNRAGHSAGATATSISFIFTAKITVYLTMAALAFRIIRFGP